MTLSEKCAFLSGKDMQTTKSIERLGVDSIFLSDGPGGLRKQTGGSDHLGLHDSLPSICWPSASTLASSWDIGLCEQFGQYLGKEAAALGVNVILGPGLNIVRSPLCGRNFEYFSEDPWLSGKLAAGVIRGIQSQGVAACPKHFAANSQELNRMTSNSVLDERTLREIYLTNFEIVVKEGCPKSIMSAYNKINGTYANENELLLRKILREEWGFEGVVVSDWGGSNDHVEGVRAGSCLEMPGTGGDSDRQLELAVREGRISEEIVDRCVDRLLNLVLSITSQTQNQPMFIDKDKHHSIAEKTAEQSIILLKNQSEILPLKAGTSVALIGVFAKFPRYQGAGSSHVNPTRLDNVLGLLAQFDLVNQGYSSGFRRDGRSDANLNKQAVLLAQKADVLLFFMGLPEIYETEGMDREHMSLPSNQVDLLDQLAAINPNIVVILAGGSPVEMPWIDDCKALVYAGLGGQAGASALLQVLVGQINPSAKLAVTFPLRYKDLPVSTYYPGQHRSAEYREGPYVGYRYFETVNAPVRFPFGFGLSYTSFAYRNLSVTEEKVVFTLENTGKAAGSEIVQVYIACSDGKVFRPAKELKGFAKIFLNPGESKSVEISLDDKAFRYFNVQTGSWEIETSVYQIMVGSSIRNIHLSANIFIKGTKAASPYNSKKIPSYYSGHVEKVSESEFEELLGFDLPESKWALDAPLGLNDAVCQMFYAKSGFARLVYRFLSKAKDKSIKSGKPDLNVLFTYHMTFRGMAKMTGGLVTLDMARALVVIVNGHFFKGLAQFCEAFWASIKEKSRRK